MPMDIGDWLKSLGLEQYETAFRENDVGVDLLRQLTSEDLKELGVATVGHRRRLLSAIAGLADDAASLHPSQQSEHDRALPVVTERRQITVLFCDLVGSTPLSARLDPEDLRELLTAYQAIVIAAVTGKKGYVARFVGDGVLAYFGWPNPDEAHAGSAVRAGLAIIEEVRIRQLSVRIGIATGLVVTGDLIGVGAAQTLTAVGETPNLAARLQSLAQPDTIVVSEGTRLQLGQIFEFEDLGPCELKGFDKPVSAWRVRRDTGAVSRSETVYEAGLTPLVGRHEELELLLHHWRRAKAGEGQVVLLSGEAGIGKSRLLAAFEARLNSKPDISLRYFCSPHQQDSPLHPIIARLEREAGFVRGDTAADRLGKLEAILAPSAATPEEVALFAALLSIPIDERYPVLELSPHQWKVRTVKAILHCQMKLARKQPALILLEDAHWADPSTIELLDAAIKIAPGQPMLLVISFRPEFVAPWSGRPGVSGIALNRLDPGDATALAVQVVKGHALSSSLLKRIVGQADGVPLFIEELTRTVMDAPEFGIEGTTLAVPATLQGSLMARLDRLPAAKQIAQIGAVIGREFPHKLLVAATDPQEAQLMEGINQLTASGLAFRRGTPPDAIYMFKHALVRDVAYASLPRTQRQSLHCRIGEAIRTQLPERAEVEPALVAYHFASGGMSETAVAWWRKAATQAMQRSAFAEAVAHLEKALDLSKDLDDTEEQRLSRLRLQISYGNTVRWAKGFGARETIAAFARARDLAETCADGPERLSANFGLWIASLLVGDLPTMQALANIFLRNDRKWSDLAEEGLAYQVGGITCWFAGDLRNARLHLEHARACYDNQQADSLIDRVGFDETLAVMAFLAVTLWSLGDTNGADCLIDEFITRAVRSGHALTIADAYAHAAMIELMRRERVRSASYLQAYLDLAHEHGMRHWLAYSAFHDAWLRWHAGDRAAGTAQMRDGLAQTRKHDGSVLTPMLGVLLAEAEADDGHHDAALAVIDAELERVNQTGERWYLAEMHRVRGEILLKCEPFHAKAAEDAFVRAIGIARDQSARLFEHRAATRLAQLWAAQDKCTEHRGLLAVLADGFADSLCESALEAGPRLEQVQAIEFLAKSEG
jgi:class 3 adenylate cyclase/predicted ATPase